MPNWCDNTVELYHKDPKMIDRAVDALNRGEFLNEFIPVPAELHIVAGRVGDDQDEAQIALEAAEKSNREKFGYATWYDYCVNEWGTKWDVGQDGAQTRDDANRVTATFESAWSPPLNAYEKLMDLGFEVRAYYYEPGMAFCGIWDNGDDDYYDYGGYTSEAIKDELPEALDEMFGISESVAEWEDDVENEPCIDAYDSPEEPKSE